MPKSVKKLILIIISIVIAVLNISCTSKKLTEHEPQDWTSGELYAKLNEDIKDEALKEFLLSYSEYELKIIFHDRLGNRFCFSFEHEKGKEFYFFGKLEKNIRVFETTFAHDDYISMLSSIKLNYVQTPKVEKYYGGKS